MDRSALLPIASAVDLERYPVSPLGGERAQALAQDCRAQLAATGSCLLPGFLTQSAVATMAAEVARLAHRKPGGRGSTAYLAPPDESFPDGHPRRWLQTSSVGAVAYDLIPRRALIRQLYEWDGLLDFLAAALGEDRLYRYADPLGALNIAVMARGRAPAVAFRPDRFRRLDPVARLRARRRLRIRAAHPQRRGGELRSRATPA
jgi:hypothetical protein